MWGTLTRVFDRAMSHGGQAVAIVDDHGSIRYDELAILTERVASGLRRMGLVRGTRVGLLVSNRIEFIAALFAIWRAGGAFTQIPNRSSAADISVFLREVSAGGLIYEDVYDDVIAAAGGLADLEFVVRIGPGPAPPGAVDFSGVPDLADSTPLTSDAHPTDIAFAGFTSGTSGVPKAVLIDHDHYSHYLVTTGLEVLDPRHGEQFLHVAPLSHMTLNYVLPTFLRQGTNHLATRFDAAAVAHRIEAAGITATAMVPTMLYRLLDEPALEAADVSRLRTVVYGGSPADPERLRAAVARFGTIFVQLYGGTEPGPVSVLRKQDHHPGADQRRLASAGRALPHVDIAVRDGSGRWLPSPQPGEIWVRSPGSMSGYADPGLDDATLRDGWVATGDVGYLDGDDYLFVIDRRKDMIVTGGYNVFPRQIEDALMSHPAVEGCVVVGAPDPDWGERVVAVVKTRTHADVTAAELTAHVKTLKGSVWAPKVVEFVESLPLTSLGKPDRKAVRDRYWAGRSRSVN